ncbi:glycosyltransferase family 2 protein [Thalassospira sp. HF15]|uniref:glycosyltransferase family 2 protein n=1 Tax=Thalassospira sp. HF15 TaxID=2722755 RepID=UPI001430FE3C|nr:glycosyltransferase family 2 protein [Thalassospira sp. HF15]NIY75423.1 glycosyltransferase family 2 protein [Thalassospira sp. HF15]
MPDASKKIISADKLLISIVVPVYNEEDAVSELHRRFCAVLDAQFPDYKFEFVFVDDGSRDKSLEKCKELSEQDNRVKVVELRRNYGQTAALQAGFDAAVGDIVVSLDADLQHFPEDLPKFIEKMEAGADVVCGWRHQRKEGIIRRWPSRVANWMIRKITGLEIHDVGTTYRAYRREILDDILILGEHHRFVPVFAKVAGARIEEVPIENIERPHGESNYGIGRTLNVFLDLFFLYFYTRYLVKPIRIFGKLALACGAIAGLITLYLAIQWLATGDPVVRTHSGLFVVGSLLYLAAVQFLIGGVTSELMVRQYFTDSGHKSYKVRNVWHKSED